MLIERRSSFLEKAMFSSKKGRHTFSTIVGVSPRYGMIKLLTNSYVGCQNDACIYNLEREYIESKLDDDEHIGGDPAFIGIRRASIVPVKKKPKQKLSLEDERWNHEFSRVRILVENTIAHIKDWNKCRHCLQYMGTVTDGLAYHHKIWTVASVLVNKFSPPRLCPEFT